MTLISGGPWLSSKSVLWVQLLIVSLGVVMFVELVEGASSVNHGKRKGEGILGGGGGGLKGRRRCASLDDNLIVPAGEELINANGGNGHGHLDNGLGEGDDEEDFEPLLTEMVCAKDSQFCYALWSDFANGTRKWIKQGCWEASSTVPTCESSHCVARVPKGKEVEGQSQGGPLPVKEVDGGGGGIQQETSTQGGGGGAGGGGGGGGGEPLFCCCDSDNCNMDVEINYVDPEEDSSSEEDDLLGGGAFLVGAGTNKNFAIGLVILSASVICGVMILAGGYRYWKRLSRRRREGKDGGGGGGEGGDGDGDDDANGFGGEGKGLLLGVRGEGDSLLGEDSGLNDPIQLVVLLAGGKFASVYEGKIPSLRDGPFALKCFAREQKEFFENERFIFEKYLGKHCNHENIVKYHGWQDFTVGPTTHLILVLDKICPGSLRDYLQSTTMGGGATTTEAENENEGGNVFKVQDVLKICSGIASGLSYLHGENRDEIVIAHRDLTSKNILLDGSTLTAKITDFGLSLVTSGSKYYWAGRERQAEFCSLAEAGTLRYMAPELLEGAVNLKDCENALKQADVYALALVLWEVANCSPEVRLTQVVGPPQPPPSSSGTPEISQPPQPVVIQHSLPYEEEIGKENLNMDALSRHVVQYRQRPHFRRWRDSPYTRQLRDTLIESWDAEPDARLTALCIVERLVDIKNIRIKNTDLSSNKVQGQGSNMLQSGGVGGGQQIKALQSPLESPTSGLFGADGTGPVIIDSPWTGRNPCLQRNLLVNATTSSSSSGGTEGLSTSGSILSDGTSTGGGGLVGGGHGHGHGHGGLHGHPLLLNHFDLAKNHANLNFYHNYVGGSSGGSSYTGSTTNGGGGGGVGGGNVTEVSNVSSVTGEGERHNLAIANQTRCPSAAVAPQQQHNSHPLPPSIPFVQNLHN